MINVARSSLRDKKFRPAHSISLLSCDKGVAQRVPQCETEPRAKPLDVLHKPLCLATTIVPQQLHCLQSQ